MASIHHCNVTPREEVPDDYSYINDLEPPDDEATREPLDRRFRSRIHQCVEKPIQVGFLFDIVARISSIISVPLSIASLYC